MPDLHIDAIHAFWDSYDRRTLYRVLVALERVESWAQDRDPDVDAALVELGKAIDSSGDVDISGIEGLLINILVHTRSSRAMRVMQAFDIAKPGTASQLLMHAEENNSADSKDGKVNKLFLDRNLVFERLQLLSRVFSPQRVSLVLKSLEYYQTTE